MVNVKMIIVRDLAGDSPGTPGAAAIASEVASVYEFDVKHIDSWFVLKL